MSRRTTHVEPRRPFDSKLAPCNDVAMQDRNLKIVRFIGATPSIAYCDVCKLAFRTRQEFLLDADKAKQQLQSDFDKHECKPEDDAVNDVLAQIK
jgi:hypothetical protein